MPDNYQQGCFKTNKKRPHHREILVEIKKYTASQHSNGLMRGTAGSIDIERQAD